MNIGFLGLGKLGLPCALACEQYGKHRVFGYDMSSSVIESIRQRNISYKEERAQELPSKSKLTICRSVKELVDSVDILFVAVQTPHDPEYEGITRMPGDNRDFDYSH